MSKLSFHFRHIAKPMFAAVSAMLISTALWAAEPAGISYPSVDAASQALFEAANSGDRKKVAAIFGPLSAKLGSGDPVQSQREREAFIKAYQEKHGVRMQGEDRATLVLGNDEWPFPVPLVRQGNAWRFDTAAGLEEIINRRVGRNETHAEQTLLAIVDAQHEYAAEDRDGDGVREYAEKFASSPGRMDGLYWPPETSSIPSPLGPLVASAVKEGQKFKGGGKPQPYWGYHFRMLSAQGSEAKGGSYGYKAGGNMLGGFAVIAYPAEYGSSGVMTFVVNHEGVVFEKDLGPDTARLASSVKQFNPGAGWVESAKVMVSQ